MIGIQGEGAKVKLRGTILATIASKNGLQSIVEIEGNRIAVPYSQIVFERRADQ